tara:strand:- start:1254 stop:1820 length:567 start_codon:yes stop_codon:yes gene_type:complete
MSDYKNASIYKITCNDNTVNETYIGSTKNFKKRMTEHKSVCNNPNSKAYTNKKYKIIRDNGNWSNWEMTKVKDFPCNTRKELRMEEQKYMSGGSLNIIQSYTTKEERLTNQKKYYKKTKPIRQIKSKEYYQINQVKLRANRLLKFDCECSGKYCKGDTARHMKSPKHQNYLKKKTEEQEKDKQCIIII